MLKELIIKVDNQEIHLSPELTVPVQQTNIPFEHCKFRTHEDIYWKVELIEFNPDNNCWKMNVLDYFVSDTQNFERQKSTRRVERIAFEKFDWEHFEQHLSNYQKIKLLDVLHNHDTNRFFREEVNPSLRNLQQNDGFPGLAIKNKFLQEQDNTDLINPNILEGFTETHLLEFNVYFTDAQFLLGYVTFSKRISELYETIKFKIKNDYILPEFDHIKSWFAKKLKSKKFKVIATITVINGNINDIDASSDLLDLINAELIYSIRYNRTLALTKSPKVSDIAKALFTANEIFAEIQTTDIESNVFKQNEQDILSLLLGNHKTRNRKQLEYLSGNKQSEPLNIKFTHHPNFGFLFFIEGAERNHFVWELLNSHATYIWSFDKSEKEIGLQYKRIESSINLIRDIGRDQYKRSYRHDQNDKDLVFNVIEHDDITSNFTDGFVKWKQKLNEKIT